MSKKLYSIVLMIWYLLNANTIFAYTRQDSLKGGNGTGRNWWDVTYYNLNVDIDPDKRTISGDNEMVFTVTGDPRDSMQIDLQQPMALDSVFIESNESHTASEFNLKLYKLAFRQEGDIWWVLLPNSKNNIVKDGKYRLTLHYHGKPKEATNPPWEGGFIWKKDEQGKPWVSVACQGQGSSCWWPGKDYQADEPDEGAAINITYPKGLSIIGNGRQTDSYTYRHAVTNEEREGAIWEVSHPINTYNITFYIGDYVHWKDTMQGEGGTLDLDFYALSYNEEKARKQFSVVKPMLHCFEHWMGPYPFYEDGYKLVEAPFLGMEHQSAVAYGNEYKMGYQGKDRSGTGFGKLFDFIIVHETGHEWFGNNITAGDMTENWLHEGFTTYTEGLFAECAFGRDTAFEYIRGEWKNILNITPVIGNYGVRDEGAGDRYDKGSAVVHMVRAMMHDDEKFRQLLRGLNKEFYHKIASSAEVEKYIINFTGLPLKPFFEQYLRTKKIPELEWYVKDRKLFFRFNNVVPAFALPLTVSSGKISENVLVKGYWQDIPWKKGGYNISVSADFLMTAKP